MPWLSCFPIMETRLEDLFLLAMSATHSEENDEDKARCDEMG